MVGGLVLIAARGIVVGIWLAVLIAKKGFWQNEVIVVVHLVFQ